MRTLETSRPGHKGTRELVARYGTNLLCVRYRDQTAASRAPVAARAAPRGRAPLLGPNSAAPRVALRIHWGETDLRQRIKSAGSQWDRRLWLLRRDHAERLGLLHRVAAGAGG